VSQAAAEPLGSPVTALAALAGEVAGRARAREQVEVYLARSTATTVRAYGGAVESLSQATSAGVGVRVVRDGRQGFAHAGTLEPDALAETLDEARDNASFGTADEHAGLAVPDGVAPAPVDPWDDALAAATTDDKVALALALEQATVAGDPRITGVRTAAYGDGRGEAAVATSTGIAAAWRSGTCYLSVSALAADRGETQTGHGVSVGRRLEDLDVAEAAGDAVDRATRMLGSRPAPSRRLTVLLDPHVTASFLGVIGATLNGGAVLKGRSLFAGRVGEEVASPLLTLVDDPTDTDSLGAAAFDAEGLASRRNALVEAGVLQAFLYDTWSARRAGTASTASAVRSYATTPGAGARALAIAPGTLGEEELLARVGDGLLVQGVSGLHSGVNTVSGDFSVGAEGLVIRGGEVAEPVREVTIASTLQRMLRDVVAVGADRRWLPGGTGSASLAIADVSLSGT
jgi:PmbA protein